MKYYCLTFIKGNIIKQEYIFGYEVHECINELVIVLDVDYIELKKNY